MRYDYLVVGSGMFGATFARIAADAGKKVLVVEKRDHIAGNCYSRKQGDIHVHEYGPHQFHTKVRRVWDFLGQFTEFNHYRAHIKANVGGKIYSIPPNMMMFHQLWGVTTREQAIAKINSQRVPCERPTNLEEYFLDGVGREVYEKFFEGYTAKQWGRPPSEVALSVAKRLPLRMTWDDRYFNDEYEGVPKDGYTAMFERMLEGIEVVTEVDYLADRGACDKMADKVIYTGRIDEYFDCMFGELEYRSLRFEHKEVDGDYQGNAIINYPDKDVPYTRIVEHKHFMLKDTPRSVVTYEFPDDYSKGKTPYYTINDDRNNDLHHKYRIEWSKEQNKLGGGRLFDFRYYDMDTTCASAIAMAKKEGLILPSPILSDSIND